MASQSLRSLIPAVLAAALVALPAFAAAATDAEAARTANEKASRDVLQRLFAACPGARAQLRAAEGFATFTGVGAGASGSGVAKPTRTRTPAYIQFQSAPGAAGKRDLVFVFKTRDDLSTFAVKGASLGGAATAGEAGDCSQGLTPGVRVFQLEGKKLAGGDAPTRTYSNGRQN
jgi:hypothetical protein